MTHHRKYTRIAIIFAFVPTFAYGLACAYLWVRQERFIFMPRKEIQTTPSNFQLSYKDVYVAVASADGRSESLHAWWIPAQQPSGKTLLYLHGSALNIGANVAHARRFHDLGFDVLLVSYRGYGMSDGGFPSETQVYADARAAWDYLVRQEGIAPGRILIYGHSIGGAVAIDLAVRQPDAAGLIVEATFTSMVDLARQTRQYRIFPLDLLVHQRFDSLAKVDDLKMPVLFIHGTHDHLVPVEMSHTLFANAPEPKRLKLIAGGGHVNNAAVAEEDYLTAVAGFVESLRGTMSRRR